jgi:hypothetical protein
LSLTKITLGPVLSFRGVDNNGNWLVTALVGIPASDTPPPFLVDGRECPAPFELLTHQKQTYLRYELTCSTLENERRVEYGLADDTLSWSFTVPGTNYSPRMAYVSCNGFSDPTGIRKLVRPANAVWEDLLANHDVKLRPKGYLLDKEQLWHEARTHDKGLQRFHILLMGGDQIYFDSIWEEIEALRNWVSLSRKKQLAFKVSATLANRIEAYYLGLYSQRWLANSRAAWGSKTLNLDAADAMASMPTVMMWDDHDIFDGWGSYSCEMQQSELFQTLFDCARKAFWIFQLQHHPDTLPPLRSINRPNVSLKDPQFEAIDWADALKKDALSLPLLNNQPGFTFGFHVGPVSILVADLRTERSRTQVMGSKSWDAMQAWLSQLPGGQAANPGHKCQHLLFLSSVPVAHPKLSLTEGLMDTFGHDHVTDSNADDLRDHWAHDDHEGERKRLLESLTKVAELQKVRVSILSGDVHVAAWATIYRRDVPPNQNWAQIHQFTSSAVVHPSLMGVLERIFLSILNSAASKPQSLDIQHTVEMMLFPGHNRYVMPARNWLALELDLGKLNFHGSKLWATWRCETEDDFSNHLHAVHPAYLKVES